MYIYICINIYTYIHIYIYIYIYDICDNRIESLQSARLVKHNIIGEMKSQFFIGMLL